MTVVSNCDSSDMVWVTMVSDSVSDTLHCFSLQVSPRDVNRFQLVSPS